MNNLSNAGIFLISTIFDIYLFILCVRLILAFERASVFNPVTQLILKLTEPVIVKIRRVIPTVRKLELSTFCLMFLLELLKLIIITILFYDGIPGFGILFLLALIGVIKIILNTFFFAILLYAILSWIETRPTPLSQILGLLSAPILRPLRRFIPLISGFDVTPVVALILLQVFIILL